MQTVTKFELEKRVKPVQPPEGAKVYILTGGVWRYGVAEYHKGEFLQVHDEDNRHAYRGYNNWILANVFEDCIKSSFPLGRPSSLS